MSFIRIHSAGFVVAPMLAGVVAGMIFLAWSPAATERAASARDDAHDAPPLPPQSLSRLGSLWFREPGEVQRAAFSPDGLQIATAGSTVRLWDAATGKAQSPLSRQDGPWLAVAFSKDGKRLAASRVAGPGEQSVHVWDLPGGKEIVLGNVPRFGASALALSPDGKLLAMESQGDAIDGDGQALRDPLALAFDVILTVWDVEKAEARFRLKGHKERIFALAFSLDGKLLASAGGSARFPLDDHDSSIRLWDVGEGKLLAELEGHKAKVESVAFAPDGKTLVSSSRDQTIRLWDVAKREAVRRIDVSGCLVAMSPDGKKLASGGGWAETIQFLDQDTGEKLSETKGGGLGLESLSFSPGGKTLAGTGGARAIRLWDVKTGEETPRFAGHWNGVTAVAFSPDGKTLASQGGDSTVRMWEASSAKLRCTFSCVHLRSTGRPPSICTLAFTPDGGKLVGLGNYDQRSDNAFLVWDASGGERIAAFPTVKREFLRAFDVSVWPSSVSVAPDGDTAVVADNFGLSFWSLKSRNKTKEFVLRPPSNVTTRDMATDVESCAVFSPDGRTLAAFSPVDHLVRLWDSKAGLVIREIPTEKSDFNCLSFSPDGQLLAGCGPAPAHVWETASGALLGKFGDQKPDGVRCVAWAPDGRRLAAATKASVDVWDVLTGEELSKRGDKPLFVGHLGAVLCVAWSPDGKTIASGSEDTTILMWDASDLAAKTPAVPVGEKEGDKLWDDLAAPEAAVAYKAVLAMLGAPEKAAALIKKHVPPTPKLDAKRVAALIADLDSEEVAKRDAATKELIGLGEAVEPAVREAADGMPPEEVKIRCKTILASIGNHSLDAEGLRRVRAVQVLERLATRDARAVLKSLAEGAPGRVSRDAKLALDRLDKKAP
jgi:WD40 repeat protein